MVMPASFYFLETSSEVRGQILSLKFKTAAIFLLVLKLTIIYLVKIKIGNRNHKKN